jgi:uncharacterized protein YdhG (YjbR/CyaY superfamily)
MQYDQPTPAAYLAHLDDDWRRTTLLALRELIQAAAPEAEESIQYRMLAFGEDGRTLCHLNAQKAYVSLYVGNTGAIDRGRGLLQGLSVGKGCVRFSKTIRVDETRIEEFIQAAVERWRRGENTSC